MDEDIKIKFEALEANIRELKGIVHWLIVGLFSILVGIILILLENII